MKCCLLLACLLAVAAADTAANQRQTAQTRAGDITADLYMTLRNIAFPSHKLTDTTSVDGRFLMLTPGKILNFLDYYPGAEYTQFVNVSRCSGACMHMGPGVATCNCYSYT